MTGETVAAIALDLGCSPKTVEYHRAQLYATLKVATVGQVLALALASGLAQVRPAKV